MKNYDEEENEVQDQVMLYHVSENMDAEEVKLNCKLECEFEREIGLAT